MSRNTNRSREEIIKKSVGSSLQKRVLKPEEIAELAVYLASDEAEGITGQAINLCRGRAFY